jgi:hypothetical protein
MARQCWKDACRRLQDDKFVKQKAYGINTHCIPMHISFIYSGTRLCAACGNTGSYHAEQNAIKRLGEISTHKPVRVFVTKISGSHAMSRPCQHCTNIILRELPQARVYYTDYDGTLCEDVSRDTAHVSVGQMATRKHCPRIRKRL